jgi:DNA polymerase
MPPPKRSDAERTLASARRKAKTCRRCPLFERATQTVFGDGPAGADLMLVGEQPGDKEDLTGQPFVGPAGALLDRALEAAGIDRARVYVTNAVKHFKWTERGKRRIHEKPNREEILACRFWLEEELKIVRPRIIVALGATAASSLYGPKVKVLRDRGTWIETEWAPVATVTVHPSSILRAPDEAVRDEAFRAFLADLKRIAGRLRQLPKET